MAWVFLVLAGLFEVVWAVGIKNCNGFKPSKAFLIVVISMALSMILLGLAAKQIPMNIAYAVWTGIGIVGVSLYSSLILSEPLSFTNLGFICMILIGIIGLKLNA